jgi:hypothetical protein
VNNNAVSVKRQCWAGRRLSTEQHGRADCLIPTVDWAVKP